MLLAGQLSDWSVEDLLQMLHITKKSASLHIEGAERSGVVYFDEGALVGAEVSLGAAGSDDRETAVEALYVLQLLDDGTFEIRNEVPPTAIDPISVADALELASEHLGAEQALADTGLLNARGLRLAQEIDEPIILSERIWAAISVSIPAFTFAELEGRMGRAAAVDMLEQFRDLGVLEAAIEEKVDEAITVVVEDEPARPDLPDRQEVAATSSIDDGDIDPVDGTDPVIDPLDETPSMWMAEEDETFDPVEASEDWSAGDFEIDEVAASGWESPAADAEPERVEAQPATSLSEAIRAAAAAASAAGTQTTPTDSSSDGDDESLLLAEAASSVDFEGAPVDGGLRRTVRSLVSSPDTTLVQGVLDDLGSRFRSEATSD